MVLAKCSPVAKHNRRRDGDSTQSLPFRPRRPGLVRLHATTKTADLCSADDPGDFQPNTRRASAPPPFAARAWQRVFVVEVDTQLLNVFAWQFQEIFVVNLPERADRRDAMVLIGAASGLRLTFADGVRGGDVLEKTLPAGGRARKLSPGKVGSWRAHMNVLQRLQEDPIPRLSRL